MVPNLNHVGVEANDLFLFFFLLKVGFLNHQIVARDVVLLLDDRLLHEENVDVALSLRDSHGLDRWHKHVLLFRLIVANCAVWALTVGKVVSRQCIAYL